MHRRFPLRSLLDDAAAFGQKRLVNRQRPPNSNGTTDILWRNPSNGASAGWLMANGAVAATPSFPSTSGYKRHCERPLQRRCQHRCDLGKHRQPFHNRLAVYLTEDPLLAESPVRVPIVETTNTIRG